MLDWLICLLLVFGAAMLLNKTAFKRKSASSMVAWSLTVLIFLLGLAVLSAMKAHRFQVISDSVGMQIHPRNPLDVGGALILAWFFFKTLNHQGENMPSNAGGKNESE